MSLTLASFRIKNNVIRLCTHVLIVLWFVLNRSGDITIQKGDMFTFSIIHNFDLNIIYRFIVFIVLSVVSAFPIAKISNLNCGTVNIIH